MKQNRRKKGEQKGGGTRMQELGYKPIQIWLERDEMDLLRQAAVKDDRPLTRYVLRAAIAQAQSDLVKGPGRRESVG